MVRRALATVCLLLIPILAIGGDLQVPSSDPSPDLSWLKSGNEGHTFYYRVSNSTDQKEFNVGSDAKLSMNQAPP